jgi:hypothetical protein
MIRSKFKLGTFSLLLTVMIFTSLATANARTLVLQDSVTAQAQRITGDRFRYQSRSPLGVRVISVNQPPAEMLKAIDQGFTDLFAVARRHGYRQHLNFSDYTIFIAKADRTKDSAGNYSPDIAVPSGQYAGSAYDQGGFIYAAGMVLSNSPSAFVFAEHTSSLQRVSDVVRYEGEHIVLFFNDRNLYNQTADHSKGGGHPILK